MKRKYHLTGLIITIFTCILPVQAQTWLPLASGILNGISGIALIEQQDASASFLVVHDNKNQAEPRVGWLTVQKEERAIYRTVKWLSSNLPVDLEAITTIPGQSNQFLVLSSQGTIYHLQLTDDHQSVKILKVFSLPKMPSQSNFEGLALQKVNGVMIAAWAHRGTHEEPGMLYWSNFDLESYRFSESIQSTPLVTPLLLSNVRQISDLKIDSSGAVFITSTTDPGNNGPFTSAFYLIGTFQVQKEQEIITFLASENMIPLLHFEHHKVEAFEFLWGEKGGVVFGTDDENYGSSVYLTW